MITAVQSAIGAIIFVFIIETLITVIVNPKEQFEIVQHHTSEGEFTQNRADTFRSRSATFVGFALVIATFLLSNPNQSFNVSNALQFVWLSLGFLLVSYQLRSLTGLNRFWVNMQEKTFEYGFLSLLGLFFFLSVQYAGGIGVWALWAGIILVIVFRFYAVVNLIMGLTVMWDQMNDRTRREYFCELIKSRFQELRGKDRSN